MGGGRTGVITYSRNSGTQLIDERDPHQCIIIIHDTFNVDSRNYGTQSNPVEYNNSADITFQIIYKAGYNNYNYAFGILSGGVERLFSACENPYSITYTASIPGQFYDMGIGYMCKFVPADITKNQVLSLTFGRTGSSIKTVVWFKYTSKSSSEEKLVYAEHDDTVWYIINKTGKSVTCKYTTIVMPSASSGSTTPIISSGTKTVAANTTSRLSNGSNIIILYKINNQQTSITDFSYT